MTDLPAYVFISQSDAPADLPAALMALGKKPARPECGDGLPEEEKENIQS